jgi:site-specific recombinase XerD
MPLVKAQIFEISDAEIMVEEIKDYIKRSKSENTRKAYRTDWKDFDGWCKTKGLNSLPAMPVTIASYLIYLSKTHKAATLERKLISIRQAHSMAGKPLDKNDCCVRDTLKGIKNTIGTSQTMKAPIITEDLRSMVQFCDDDLRGKRDRALFLIGFAGAFRRSELVSLKREDLNFNKNGLEITLRRSKTDQEGKGQIVPIPYGSNPDTCPVRSLKSWLEESNIVSGYIFRGVDKHGNINSNGLTPTAVGLIIKKNGHINDRKEEYGGHSLRAGFCTQAAINNVSVHSSMRQARQKKVETHQKYIRIANMWTDCAATKLGL